MQLLHKTCFSVTRSHNDVTEWLLEMTMRWSLVCNLHFFSAVLDLWSWLSHAKPLEKQGGAFCVFTMSDTFFWHSVDHVLHILAVVLSAGLTAVSWGVLTLSKWLECSERERGMENKNVIFIEVRFANNCSLTWSLHLTFEHIWANNNFCCNGTSVS